jgi:hypothetical protein
METRVVKSLCPIGLLGACLAAQTPTTRVAGEEILVAVNTSNRPFEGKVAIESSQDFRPLVPADNAVLSAIKLEAWGWRLYRRPLR